MFAASTHSIVANMAQAAFQQIVITTTLKAPLKTVWNCYTHPIHIIHWNNASEDWHTTFAEADMRQGGKFLSRMEAKDGSAGFDFTGTYTQVKPHSILAYELADSRKVEVLFEETTKDIAVTVTFDAENENPIDMQKAGWYTILSNFKAYTENPATRNMLHFDVKIECAIEMVFAKMFEKKTYNAWAGVFEQGSTFKGDWQRGSQMHFVYADEDEEEQGLIAKVRENIPNRFISLEYIGLVQNSQEVFEGEDVEDWEGALENYSFRAKENATIVSVDLDSTEDFVPFLKSTWPKALAKLKELCEE